MRLLSLTKNYLLEGDTINKIPINDLLELIDVCKNRIGTKNCICESNNTYIVSKSSYALDVYIGANKYTRFMCNDFELLCRVLLDYESVVNFSYANMRIVIFENDIYLFNNNSYISVNIDSFFVVEETISSIKNLFNLTEDKIATLQAMVFDKIKR